MKIAIGAIFRNEYKYIIEWLAWHEMAGFDTFIIADNGSNDGTTELLEALSEAGKIHLIYQPIIEKKTQLIAYNRIAQYSLDISDAILFIDADEYVVHESMVDGEECKYLERLLDDPATTSVGINWRVFGSSGLIHYDERPVIERFTDCCADKTYSKNSYIKSVSKTKYVNHFHVHNTIVMKGSIVDCHGRQINRFISFQGGTPHEVNHSGVTYHIANSPLRINHYAVKSMEEFQDKRSRGDAMLGVEFKRAMAYFMEFDFKDENFSFPIEKLNRLKNRMKKLESELEKTSFFRKLRGAVDISNKDEIRGWLVDDNGVSNGLRINVFVNGDYRGRAGLGFYRADLHEKGISKDGFAGFRFTHASPLKSGDRVEVRVHGNRFKFPKNACVIIE